MRDIVSPSEAIAPFHVVVIGARYCAVTDAICGTWTKRDSAMTYATYGGACWRAAQQNRSHEGDDYGYEVRDALGRAVVQPRPRPDVVDDGLPF